MRWKRRAVSADDRNRAEAVREEIAYNRPEAPAQIRAALFEPMNVCDVGQQRFERGATVGGRKRNEEMRRNTKRGGRRIFEHAGRERGAIGGRERRRKARLGLALARRFRHDYDRRAMRDGG